MFLLLLVFSFSDLSLGSSCDGKFCIKNRDPFYISGYSAPSNKNKIVYFKQEPKVLGIISVNEIKSAIVLFGNQSIVVKEGETVKGYTIVKINSKNINVITPEKEETKWFI